jgi:pimeloyl-ACP methyl ester carboxylesterase
MDQVQDLHGLLEQTGVPGPYILVSFHLSSYNLILYTDQYPQDVAGLVAINTWYPTHYENIIDKIGPATADTPASWKEWIDFFADYKTKKVLVWDTHPEYIDQQASEAQVLKVTSLKDTPLTIIQSDRWTEFPVEEINQMAWESVQKSNKDFCKLSSRCKMVAVPGTHFNSVLMNEAVDKAIQEVYDAVKEP